MLTPIEQKLLTFWYYVAIVLGLTSYRYDGRGVGYRRIRLLHYYNVMANILLLVVFYYYNHYGTGYLDIYMEQKRILYYSNRFIMRLQLVTLLYSTYSRLRNDQNFLEILNQLEDLERKTESHSSCHNSAQFYSKYLIFCTQNGMQVWGYIIVSAKRAITGMDIFLNSYYLITEIYITAIGFVYFVILSQLSRILESIRNEMSASFAKYPDGDASDLRRIRRKHESLLSLLRQVQGVFSGFIAIYMVSSITSNTTVLYFAFIFGDLDPSLLYQFMTHFMAAAFIVNTLDVFLLNWCCSTLTTRHQQIVNVLEAKKCFLREPAGRACELYLLSGKIAPVGVSIWGMFNLNRSTAMAIVETTILYGIIVIQFDLHLESEKRTLTRGQ